MKKLILLAVLAGITIPATAQKSKKATKNAKAETPATAQAPSQEEGEMMRITQENRMITPMHHRLMQMAGTWRETTTVWSSPGAEPATSTSVREGRPLMEGRFIEFTIMGDSKEGHYEARSVVGWDNLKHVYVKTWFDNLSPGVMVLEGTLDEAKNTIEFRGVVTDPRSRQPVQVRQVLNLGNPQVQVLEIYTDFKGKEYKAMEIKSSRS
jgi:hypothetical protein